MKKLAGYFLLSLFSFGVFTAIFHTAARAEVSLGILTPPTPTPTITPSPTPTNTPTPTPTNTPTPTSTPTPTPTPQPVSAPTDLESLFAKFSSEYSVDKEKLKRIADCESHFNANANYNDMYIGMFQFSEGSWVSTRTHMNLDSNPALRTNAEESIRTAAYLVSVRGTSPWPLCLR